MNLKVKKVNKFRFAGCNILLALVIFFPAVLLASETVGTVSAPGRFAWSENMGWINFSPAQGGVMITDEGMTGNIWNENYGWINLAPATAGVKNDGEGNLSGQAWGENTGWIDFLGVEIGSDGVFAGQATGTISGRITFDCSRCLVQTDWRPIRSRSSAINSGSRKTHGFVPTSTDVAENSPSTDVELYPEPAGPLEKILIDNKVVEALKNTLALIIPDFIQETLYGGRQISIPIADLLPKNAPASLVGQWNLIPATAPKFALHSWPRETSLALSGFSNLIPETVPRFVMQSLPKETHLLAQKFPQLSMAFEKVGISRMSDVRKLVDAQFNLPGFSQMLGLNRTKVVPGKFALTIGIPSTDLNPNQKKLLPTETIFARSFDERLDLKTNLTFNDLGQPIQQISSIVGKKLDLVVKPEAPVRKVTGYIVLSKRENAKTAIRLPMNSLAASAMFATPRLAQEAKVPEKKFVLEKFEYTDADGDGIYTASVTAPLVSGEYEVITVMDYYNPELGSKEIRLIAVIDPEGYVFTKSGLYEARISSAKVSIYWLNSETGNYELWPAKEYLQTNPQVTDERGTYSFLVPEGSYYLKVEAGNFKAYQGESFVVEEGNGVHANIELVPTHRFLGGMLNFNTLLIVLVGAISAFWIYRIIKKRRHPG